MAVASSGIEGDEDYNTKEFPLDTVDRFYDELMLALGSLKYAFNVTKSASAVSADQRREKYEEALREAERHYPSDSLPLGQMTEEFRKELLERHPDIPSTLQSIASYRAMLQGLLETNAKVLETMRKEDRKQSESL